MDLSFTEVKNGEKSRTYIFGSESVTIENVIRICVRPSGGHRLETADGSKYIVNAGWLAIKIVADVW